MNDKFSKDFISPLAFNDFFAADQNLLVVLFSSTLEHRFEIRTDTNQNKKTDCEIIINLERR